MLCPCFANLEDERKMLPDDALVTMPALACSRFRPGTLHCTPNTGHSVW